MIILHKEKAFEQEKADKELELIQMKMSGTQQKNDCT